MLDKKQAQELAQTVRLKSRAWMDDDQYGSFLRNEIFGSFPLKVSVIPTETGESFVVVARWEHMHETFHSVVEWEAFAEEIEGRMGLASLTFQGGSEQKERLNL